MSIRKPDYYERFHCIGSACSDTCCAGWEIEVDEETARTYRQLPGPFGERIRRCMKTTEEESYFELVNGRCPLLNEENLCDIITQAGEGALCDICREHPRFYNWYGAETEAGLGLCCEEAERLLFESSSPAGFVTEEDGAKKEDTEEEQFIGRMMCARETAFSIVQDRTRTLENRLISLLTFADRLQECMDKDDSRGMKILCSCQKEKKPAAVQTRKRDGGEAFYLQLLREFRSLEAMDPCWTERLGRLEKNLNRILGQASAFSSAFPQMVWEYEHLMVYFVNRYFMESVYDMDVVSKVRFGTAGLLLIRLLEIQHWTETGQRSCRDRDGLIRSYSKEIEYCPENVTQLVEDSWKLEAFQTEALSEMLSVFA